MVRRAQIVGKVEYREGDGPNIPIRQGPIEVQATEIDVTLSWEDGDHHGSAAMPISDFQRYVAKRAIKIDA